MPNCRLLLISWNNNNLYPCPINQKNRTQIGTDQHRLKTKRKICVNPENLCPKKESVVSFQSVSLFNAPSVEEVDLLGYTGAAGDEIIIMASDDFDVLGVQVALTDGESNPLESGAAVETPANSTRWVYTATAAVETGTTVRPSTLLSVAEQASQ